MVLFRNLSNTALLKANVLEAYDAVKTEVQGFGRKTVSFLTNRDEQSTSQAAFRQDIMQAVKTAYNNAANFVNNCAEAVQTPLVAFSPKLCKMLVSKPKFDTAEDASNAKKMVAKTAEKVVNVLQTVAWSIDHASTMVGKHVFLALNSVLGFAPGGTALSTLIAGVLRATTLVALSALAVTATVVSAATAIAVAVVGLAVLVVVPQASTIALGLYLNNKIKNQAEESKAQAVQIKDLTDKNAAQATKIEGLTADNKAQAEQIKAGIQLIGKQSSEVKSLKAKLEEAVNGSDDESDYEVAPKASSVFRTITGLFGRN